MNTNPKQQILDILYQTVESEKDLHSCCEEFSLLFAELENDDFKDLCAQFLDMAIECLKNPTSKIITTENIRTYSNVYNEICELYTKLQNLN